MSAYPLTWFRHLKDARGGVRVSLDRDELAAQLVGAAPWHDGKDALPLISTATFASNHRLNRNVETVSMLGLDLDERQADPAAYVALARGALGGVEVFAYSTFSSEPGAFKLRALVPYDRPATGDEHRASWAFVERQLEKHGVRVDRACSDPARGFYVWAVPLSGAYWQAHLEGEPWPATRAAGVELRRRAADAKRRPPPPPSSASGDVVRARAYVAKMPHAVAGAGGHNATFAVACRLVHGFGLSDVDAWALLCEFNARCAPPWSDRELRHKLRQAKERACNTSPVAARPRARRAS